MPIDVTSILGYGKRDVSRYPILLQARLLIGSGYQSLQERAGTHPLLAAPSSNYDFIGAYDFSRQAGNLRVADHCISPGETWPWMGSTPYPATSESLQAVIRKGCPD